MRLGHELSNRWPRIRRYLRVESSEWVEDDFHRWYFATERLSFPDDGMAVAYEEWAEFYEWRLEQRAEELADDAGRRLVVERWTDDMAYCCRRCAAYARGEDPGEPVPLSVRRPDLDAALRARVATIIAELDAESEPAEVPVRRLRRVG